MGHIQFMDQLISTDIATENICLQKDEEVWDGTARNDHKSVQITSSTIFV